MAVTTPSNPRASVPAALSDLVQAGTAALSDGDLRLALEKFEAVVNAFPDRPEGHNNLGALYSSIGDYPKAEECFDRVLAILPGNVNILYNRGIARSRQEKFEGARLDFAAVLQSTPEDAETLNNLGVAAFMQGSLEAAREHFAAAVKSRPDYVNAVLNHVDLECAAGNLNTAVQMCENFLARTPSLEVRRRHFELLCDGCRETMEKASRSAESILAATDEDQQVSAELERLRRARTLLATA